MAASPDILRDSAVYIRIESVASIFTVLFNFACVALVALGRERNVYALTGVKLILCVVSDLFFVRPFGVNGIGYSNTAVNLILFAYTLLLIQRSGYGIVSKKSLSFLWAKDFAKKGSLSGLESFVRNIAYMLMVSRMVNIVGEQGTYWVANNFIWGWMLLPVIQLGELIKQETATDEKAVEHNSLGYFSVTSI